MFCGLREFTRRSIIEEFGTEFFIIFKCCIVTSINASSIVANLYMEKVESRALITFTGTAPSHWLRYVDDT